jgi:hypothetical protein
LELDPAIASLPYLCGCRRRHHHARRHIVGEEEEMLPSLGRHHHPAAARNYLAATTATCGKNMEGDEREGGGENLDPVGRGSPPTSQPMLAVEVAGRDLEVVLGRRELEVVLGRGLEVDALPLSGLELHPRRQIGGR